jgi:hypothetical protein
MTSTAPSVREHTPEEEWLVREAALDQTIESSFPASDPPSTNPNPFDQDALPHAATRDGGDALD